MVLIIKWLFNLIMYIYIYEWICVCLFGAATLEHGCKQDKHEGCRKKSSASDALCLQSDKAANTQTHVVCTLLIE